MRGILHVHWPKVVSNNVLLSETESESDSDNGNATPALQSPIGVAPPPPLRNIPHQTTDSSPTTSLLFSNQQYQLTVPHQRHSIPNLSARVSAMHNPGGMSRKSLPNDSLSTTNRPIMVVIPKPPPRISTLSAQQTSRKSIDNGDLAMVTLPDRRVIVDSDATRVIVSAPISTSTPKAKRALFPDAKGAKAAAKHRKTIKSEPELRKVKEEHSQDSVSKNEERASEVGLGEASPLAAGETVAIQSASEYRELPKLQRSSSNDLSSSESSSNVSSSLSESDQSERRDRFDPGK